jgi:solute carrier family 35 protein E3
VGLKVGGYFVPRRVGRVTSPRLLLLAAALGIATPVSNLSLKLNSVGVYTIAKLMVTPAIVLVEYFLRGKTVSCTRVFLLLIVAVGVAINSVADIELTYEGIVVLAVWLPVAVVYKVGWSVAIKEDNWQTFPLMYELYPYAICFTALLCPMLDDLTEVAELKWLNMNSAMLLLTSGFGAFLVNVSGFLVMGKMSPLTHVILGQLKATVNAATDPPLGGKLTRGHKCHSS